MSFKIYEANQYMAALDLLSILHKLHVVYHIGSGCKEQSKGLSTFSLLNDSSGTNPWAP